jgi:hypothetical protein
MRERVAQFILSGKAESNRAFAGPNQAREFNIRKDFIKKQNTSYEIVDWIEMVLDWV